MRSIRMSRWAAAVLLTVGLAFAAGTALAADPWVDPHAMTYPPLHEIKVPQPERYVLGNGMIVYLLEDHDFPLVDAQALVHVGSMYDPADKVGLASVTGTVMRTGGTASIAGDDLDQKLESMGASVEVNVGNTQGTASMSVLSQDVAQGISILSDVLRNPAFPQEKIDLAKKQEKTDIAGRNDEMLSILMREIPKLIYGPDSPYARNTEYATIDAIGRDDLVAFHKEFFHPDRTILTVYGDFDSKQMKKLLDKSFGDWAKSTQALPADPKVVPNDVKGLFVVNKDDMTNSGVVLGQVGIRMDNPDYAPLMVYHEVMGGGFSSRLVNEIRTKRGLAYASGSAAGAGMHHPGGMFFYALTQSDSTTVTLGILKDEVKRSLAEPFTEKEVSHAKDSILNSLVFSLSSKGAVLNRMATYEFYGYPQDFLQKYQEAVKQVTPQQVLEAARREINYDDLAALIVGTVANFQGALDQLGPYQTIDITIPEPQGEAMEEASPQSLKKGRELLDEAAKAMGAEAYGDVKDLTVSTDAALTVQGMQLQISGATIHKGWDCERSEQRTPMGNVVQVVCGDQGWAQSPQGVQDMPAPAVAQQKAEWVRELPVFLQQYPNMQAQALEQAATVDGNPADVVYVQSDAVKDWKVYIDRATHRIVRMEYRTKNPMTGSPVTATENLSDYREVNGFQWPYQRAVLYDGDPFATVTVTEVKVNSGVGEDQFTKP